MVADTFASMATFMFAVVTLLSGIFTAYFGQGRSRGIGAALIVVGLLVGAVFAWFANLVPVNAVPPVTWSSTATVDGIVAVIGAVAGGVVGVGVFLASIMNA